MNYKTTTKTILITMLVSVAIFIFLQFTPLSLKPNNDKQTQPATERYAGELPSHKWTTWSEDKSPEMYRIVGKADIKEKASVGHIIYNHDNNGRLWVIATLNAKNLQYGKRKRADISHIKPEGWTDNKQVEITFADGTKYHGHFWNRSHLLAHMLGGEDAEYNLITGTRCQNVGKNNTRGGMQYAENKAANYIKNGGKYIIYNVYPAYAEGDIIPRSVFIDMLSDDGTINEQVEVFNAAPGFEIDYTIGHWHHK